MFAGDRLSTAEILDVFIGEIIARDGRVVDTFHDGARLFTRSILPLIKEVRPQDRLQGGVALKALAGEVWLHPYVFRQVCRNGAIMAQSLQTRHFTDADLWDPDQAERLLREAVEACCAEEVFTQNTADMRSAQDVEADLALNLLPHLAHLGARVAGQFVSQILERFFEAPDRSRFGLMNAVTSVARDTRDPVLRWNLEELGGGIPALKPPRRLPGGAAAGAARDRRMVCA
jgi:hypothetical protein